MPHFPRVDKASELKKAGPSDIIRLLPAPGQNPLFIQKMTVEVLVSSIAAGDKIHISGPTGSAKTSLMDALSLEPRNFAYLCEHLGLPIKPLTVYGIEMCIFDSPSELYQRRAIRSGTTYDEASPIIKCLQMIVSAQASGTDAYWCIYLKEIGRCHSSSVMGGLLDLLTNGPIFLPDSTRLEVTGLSWVCDSNYQAEGDAQYVLVPLDEALRRRFSTNLTMNYLPLQVEEGIVKQLVREQDLNVAEADIKAVVRLGHEIRRRRALGELQSLVPPTIYGFMSCLRLKARHRSTSLMDALRCTLIGNASSEDMGAAWAVVSEVLGVGAEAETLAGGVTIW